MFSDKFIVLGTRSPAIFLDHFDQEVEIRFCPANDPMVAAVTIDYANVSFDQIRILRFAHCRREKGIIFCLDEKDFRNLPKEVRNAITHAIESFRNDCMVI